MTVGELRAALADYPDSLRVLVLDHEGEVTEAEGLETRKTWAYTAAAPAPYHMVAAVGVCLR